MKSVNFPGCCTAKVLHNLGGTPLAAGRKSNWPEEKLKAWLMVKIRNYRGRSCLVVTTNDQQTTVNKVLKELGFEHSAWMSKTQHSESKLRLWWKEP